MYLPNEGPGCSGCREPEAGSKEPQAGSQEHAYGNVEMQSCLIADGELPHVNEKSINARALSYYTGGEQVIASDFSQVHQVAMQCPAAGGPSVYTARALLEIITDSIVYDDENVCFQSAYFRLKSETEEVHSTELTVVPNPANETVEIKLNTIADGICHIRLMDALGNTVFKGSFNCSDKSYLLNVQKLVPGIYQSEVLINNIVIDNAKLVIVR
jgi:hypothetical protein